MVRPRVALLPVLLLAWATAAGAEEIAGATGPIAWRVTEPALGRQTSGGKEQALYSFSLAVRNRGPRLLTLTRYEARISYRGLLDDTETTASGHWSLQPGKDVKLPLGSALECGDMADRCRLPIGPTVTVVLLGSDHQGAPVRHELAFTLPPAPGEAVVPPPRIARVAAAPPDTAAVIPLRLANNVPFVIASLNGSAVTMLVDTGAQITMLHPEAAARAGIVVPAQGPRMPMVGLGTASVPLVVTSLTIGEYSVENLLVGVAAVPVLEMAHADGLLGGNFMALFRLTLDRRARQLRLEPSE